jgi:hypothetical protein
LEVDGLVAGCPLKIQPAHNSKLTCGIWEDYSLKSIKLFYGDLVRLYVIGRLFTGHGNDNEGLNTAGKP